MKKIIGFLALFVSLSATVLTVLKIWGIDVFSAQEYQKIGWTILTTFIASIILIVLYAYFFKDNTNRYTIEKNKVAGKKIN